MDDRPSVVVLGVTGMLGSLVTQYFRNLKKYDVWGTVRTAEAKHVQDQPQIITFDVAPDSTGLEQVLRQIQPQWIINCIGVIKPYCKDDTPQQIRNAIMVNALFPYQLADSTQPYRARVIQIETDCVYSGTKGKYFEDAPHDPLDAYGKTKSLGEVKAPHVLHIRSSIIGPEPLAKASLFEWFLSQPEGGTVQGFTHHTWNGVTTLQFAHCCQMIIDKGPAFFDELIRTSSVHHYIPNKTVTKYELLMLLADIFKKQVTIEPVEDTGPAVDRTLSTHFTMLTERPYQKPMQQALEELRDYIQSYEK